MRTFLLALAVALVAIPAQAAEPKSVIPGLDGIRAGFEAWRIENHVPGLVWGIVENGALVHVESAGVQDVATGAPVTPDTRFRIASMSKAFTAYAALAVRADGRLRLEEPVMARVPEFGSWAPDVTVGDLMHHTAGFVTDDPWGDRQQPITDGEFDAMLAAGVPFTAAPRTRYEYSNFGYATLGRVVRNAEGRADFAEVVRERILGPLGMTATGYEIADVPRDKLAIGYRWEGGKWVLEPEMPHGPFGAMGGMITTARDYPKWMAHLLSGWPAPAQSGATGSLVREMGIGGGFVHQRPRPGKDGAACRTVQGVYAAGLVAARDCELGALLFHSGGYPGYGSHMLLFPEAGVGLFAFANRTYAAPLAPVWDAAGVLRRAGFIADRPVPRSPALTEAYAAAGRMWSAGRVEAETRFLAMNFLMDRSADLWAVELARLKGLGGTCDSARPVTPTGALSGRILWLCTTGQIEGTILLAPTASPQIQALRLTHVAPVAP